MNIQTVDYKNRDDNRRLLVSLKETGFAVIRGLDELPSLLTKVYAEWAEFFGSEDKFDSLHTKEKQEGYFPFKSENAKGCREKDLKEFYHLHTPFHAPEGMSPATKELSQYMLRTGISLLERIEDYLPGDVRRSMTSTLNSIIENSRNHLLRILHYPPIEGYDLGVRAAAHEDICLLTLMPSATRSGLQVKDSTGIWHDVKAADGDIILNVGDMLQEATGGYLKSTTHRVINPSSQEANFSRFSLPFFLHARADAKITNTTTAIEFLDKRLAEIGIKRK